MEGNHFVQWDYQHQDGSPMYFEAPDSPGYQHAFGNQTSLPGSPHKDIQPAIQDPTQTSDQHDTFDEYPTQAEPNAWKRDELVRLAQAKVVLLGSVAAGKTSLLNTLRYGESRLVQEGPDGRTIGIEVHSVALRPDTKLWFYDFGGHDTYHFSQQLFLTQRVIYLLAVDISLYDPAAFEKTLKHWYTILTSRLVTPVICLLATHIDLCDDKAAMMQNCQDMHDQLIRLEYIHRRRLEKELQILKKEVMSDDSQDDVGSIRKFQPRTLRQPMQRLNLLLTNRPKVFNSVCCISSKTLEGIDQFRENLVSIVTDNEALFPQKDVPGSWIELSDAIVSQKENVPFITTAEFIDLAKQFGIVGNHVQKVLAYLQSIGLVLHYQDYRQNSDLSKYVFVNPNLLLAIFGLVFNHNYFMDETRFVWKHKSILRLPPFDFLHLRKNLKERGIIGEKLLKCFWDAMGISDEVYHAIVPLLEKFDLCYEIRMKPGDAVVEGRHFLFPYLLNKKMPQEVNFMWSDDLLENFMQCGVELCFTQPNLPFGFLEKVLIRAHTYVDHCLSWKHGMVAFCDEGQDLVRIESKIDAKGNAYLVLSARVRLHRTSMARHIILLLVAVTNRVLLHHYPGIVAYWYCQCAHCLRKSLEQKYTEVVVDKFPADNIVYTSPGDMKQIQCVNCHPEEALHLEDIFPRDTENIHSLKRLMSEPCCRALKSSGPTLTMNMNYRDVMNALLRKQLLNIKQAEIIGSKPNHVERAQQLLVFLMQSDQKAFEVLCEQLKQSNDTAWLAEELLVKSSGRNSRMLKCKDSDSLSSATALQGASGNWRGSQASQSSFSNMSISNWSTYSRTSYGSTGSYIRRPYGSYITREPVQNYKRPSSTASTPQQQRKEPGNDSPIKSPEVIAAVLSKHADHVRKLNEKTNMTENERKRLSYITEIPQEDSIPTRTGKPYIDDKSKEFSTPIDEVKVATTGFVQASPIHLQDLNTDRGVLQDDVNAQNNNNNVEDYILTKPEVKDFQDVTNNPQAFDDEADISRTVSEPTNAYPSRGNPANNPYSWDHETDIDADIMTNIIQPKVLRQECNVEVPKRVESGSQPEEKAQQHKQHIQQQNIKDHLLEQQAELESLQCDSNKKRHTSSPQIKQKQLNNYHPHEALNLDHNQGYQLKEELIQEEESIPDKHQQHVNQTTQQIVHNQKMHKDTKPQFNGSDCDKDQKLDPASIIYKETDLDGHITQLQMPRDMRVRSTGDILGHTYQKSEHDPHINDRIRLRHTSQGAIERGRQKSKISFGLIGNADLGPTHVLQDMEPIELPLKPIKRSRSSSLNRNVQNSKSKSPPKTNQDDRPNTWAVPYDWEQHNSLESLHRGCPKRQSGGFIFAAYTQDLQSNKKNSKGSPPIVYSSQPVLNANEGRYSVPRPTGRKAGTLPQHAYVEPLGLPEEMVIAQSAPTHRRHPPLPPQNTQNSSQDKAILGGLRKGQLPPRSEPGQRMESLKQNLQGKILPSHTQVHNLVPSELSSRTSDGSEGTESYHTGRSRTGSNESDDATITSDISELTIESFHTTRSNTASIASKTQSHRSYMTDQAVDSFHTGQSYANSDVPDDVTITSDVSELTIDSFHTFNSGMTPTSANTNGEPLTSQISDVTLNSFKSCTLSDDEVTLTSEGSNSPEPFAIDDTPNKPPIRVPKKGHISQHTQNNTRQPGLFSGSAYDSQSKSTPRPQPEAYEIQSRGANRPPFGKPPGPYGQPSGPYEVPHVQVLQVKMQAEENAPPVPVRKDLLNKAPPIPARPPTVQTTAHRPHVTFADEAYSQKDDGNGRIKQARTVPLPQTAPQWQPEPVSEASTKNTKKSKKNKKDKKSKTQLPYVGTPLEHDKAVRYQVGNGHQNRGPQQVNNPALGSGVQHYVDTSGQHHGMIPSRNNPQVYSVHAQAQQQMPMRVDPNLAQYQQTPHDHSKPHAYVQPYVHGAKPTGGQFMDNANPNNANKGDPCETYPYKGGNGNGIVLVEEPYVSSRQINANTAPFLDHQSLHHPPHGGATARPDNQRPSRSRGRPNDRNREAPSQDSAGHVAGSHDTAV